MRGIRVAENHITVEEGRRGVHVMTFVGPLGLLETNNLKLFLLDYFYFVMMFHCAYSKGPGECFFFQVIKIESIINSIDLAYT